MNEVYKLTVEELLNLGYDVKLSKFGYGDSHSAMEDFNDLYKKGTSIKLSENSSGFQWVTPVNVNNSINLSVTHFLKKDESEKVVKQVDYVL